MVERRLTELKGQWSTDVRDLEEMITDILDDEGYNGDVELLDDCIEVCWIDNDNKENIIDVYYELVGKNTWVVTCVC